MKKLICVLLFTGFLITHPCIAQQTADTTHTMLMPDKETLYLDEQGNQLQQMDFLKKVTGGGYQMKPTIEDGKIKSLRLQPTGINFTVGVEPPDFTANDLQGKVYHLRDLKGKIVVLNFWFTSCVGCVAEMPQLNELADKYRSDTAVIFLAITFDEAKKVQQFLKTHSFTWDLAPDQAAVIKTYGLQAFPFTLVVDRNGRIAFSDNNSLQGNVVATLSRTIDRSK